MYVTIQLAKKHLLVDADYRDDDEYILSLIRVAEDAVEKNLCVPLASILVDGVLPASVFHSILLLIGNLYANREPVSFTSNSKIPYTLEFLLSMYKHYYMP